MKKTIRKAILDQRKLLSKEDVKQKSALIKERLVALAPYQKAQTLLLYMDYKNEVQTTDIITCALAEGKNIVIPVVDFDTHTLILVKITSLADMTLSRYGILEPQVTPNNQVTINDIDLVLAPGVAFDLKGYRLGYGGGYYDKLLATADRSKLTVIALAFGMQVVDQVPREDHDMMLDGLITEEAYFRFS